MRYLKSNYRFLRHVLVTPIVSSLIIPLLILDIWIEIYHRVCFPLYKIPLVKRGTYIQIDRYKLKYLNWIQKIYCMYCGYATGVLRYWVAIAAETELYWCGIKHKKNAKFVEPSHHKNFAEYNDKADFNEKYKN